MKKVMFADKHVQSILSVIVICTLPHFFNFSMLTVIACLFIWAYIVVVARHSWHLPGKMIILFFVGVFFLLAMTTNEGFTIEAFVALLALMISMKLLDIRSKKNRMTTVILCYFLIVGSLFFDDSIFATAYMFFSVLCTTAVLMHVNQPGRGAIALFKLSGILMVQALPIMILLFLLFPRIQGGLWGRAPLHAARTGFTDRMGFGDIANMAQNRDVAFRVEFDGEVPTQDHLYWRGVVLWDFDGHTWYRGVGRRGSSPRRSEASKVVNYTLTLEPHNEQWLITLDLPMRISLRRSWLLDDFSYYRWRQITQRVSYEGVSYLDANDFVQNSLDKSGIELPQTINPRARAMASDWFEQEGNPQDYINRVLSFFGDQSFAYTLKPPPLSTNTDDQVSGAVGNLVDSFLFETRKGFCEHYATAFAFLMRSAGIPARIVVGYLGGTQNLYGDYLIVRQSQAHAWCEVWLDGKGWVRVDPTTVVAPSRLSGDVTDAISEAELVGLMSYFRGTPLESWLEPVASALDLVNSRWNKWVMGYSAFEQISLFSRFGIDLESGKGTVKAFVSALIALAAASLTVSFFLLRKQKPLQDQLSLSWIEFCHKLTRIGLERKQEQGPVDFMKFVVSQRPDLESRIYEIVGLYVKLRFGNNEKPDEIMLLQSKVKQFQPKQFTKKLT